MVVVNTTPDLSVTNPSDVCSPTQMTTMRSARSMREVETPVTLNSPSAPIPRVDGDSTSLVVHYSKGTCGLTVVAVSCCDEGGGAPCVVGLVDDCCPGMGGMVLI